MNQIVRIEPCPGYEVPGKRKEHCGKVPQKGSAYCPKHLVYAAEAQADVDRKMARLRDRKAAKQELRDSLKDSPLRAYNPKFDEREEAYSR